METTVYIPTLRAGERLAQTLESLEGQGPRPRVVIADNSADGLGAELVRDRFPWALSVTFGENLGFGAALNRAVREVPGDPIVFLNDDVSAESGFIAGLTEALTPEAGMVAGVLLSEADPNRIDSAGVVADRTLLAFDHLNGEPVEALGVRHRPPGTDRRSGAVQAQRLRAGRRLRRGDLPLLRGPGPGAADATGRLHLPPGAGREGHPRVLGDARRQYRAQVRDDGLEPRLPAAGLRLR